MCKCLFLAGSGQIPAEVFMRFIPFANSKGADQPACLDRLNSAFVVRYLDRNYSMIPIVAERVNSVTCYRNDPKFSDRQVWANSVDPSQTASRRFAIPSAYFGHITLW